MRDWLMAAWQWVRTSRYTRFLEGENERLREENRGLLNSLLCAAGVAPLPAEPRATGENRQAALMQPPHRRRSWQQVGRMLEMEEARRVRRGAGNRAMSGFEFLPGTPGRPQAASSKEGPTGPPSEHRAGR
jgi:hypothetical protein